MNRVDLIGRTTKDIEISYTRETQIAVGRFTLAVNRRKKEDGADFISCKVWGRTAENMSQYVKKGHKVGISGRIETGSYKNRDGFTVYTTEVVVEDFDLLEPKHEQSTPASQPAPPAQPAEQSPHQQSLDDLPDSFEQADDDLPF